MRSFIAAQAEDRHNVIDALRRLPTLTNERDRIVLQGFIRYARARMRERRRWCKKAGVRLKAARTGALEERFREFRNEGDFRVGQTYCYRCGAGFHLGDLIVCREWRTPSMSAGVFDYSHRDCRLT